MWLRSELRTLFTSRAWQLTTICFHTQQWKRAISKKMALFWDILSTQEAKFQIWYLSEFLVVLWPKYVILKVDMPILTCIFFTFNWLTLTSEMHFVKFHPEVASCLLSRGKRKYAPLGMRLIWKYIRNYFLVYQLISHFLSYLQNYKEFKVKILDLQPEKYGLSFDIKKCTTSGWAIGDENVIGIRAFKQNNSRNT